MPTAARTVLVTNGVFQDALSSNFRFWAAVPDVQAIAFLDSADAAIATVDRPVFPPGVCTGCGCSEFDACLVDAGVGCSWIDRTQTRCSRCGPALRAPARSVKKR